MTSRNSFFRLLKEDRKRRTWTIVVFTLLCFMMTVVFELNLESYQRIQYADAVLRTLQMNIESLTESEMTLAYLYFSGIGAVLFAFQGFGWLAKREQVDFYHSQPMKREKRFAITYLNGFLFFEIPMILHIMASAALIAVRGCLNSVVIGNLTMNTMVFTASFLMIYSLSVLGIMLTGNSLLSFMTTAVIFVYPSAVRSLMNGYYSTYFKTFSNKYESPLEVWSYLSPGERFLKLYDHIRLAQWSDMYVNVLIVCVMAVVFGIIAFFLYKRRPSECAGMALAFPIIGDFFRFLIVLPCAMGFGFLFAAFSGVLSVVWLYFGTILGAVLSHGFMEVIFNFDIRAAIRKKLQLIGTAIIALVFVSVFQFDWIGYDTYVPAVEDVKNISYYINVGEYMDYYHVLDEEGIPLMVNDNNLALMNTKISREDYQLEMSKTENVEPFFHLVKAHLLNEGIENEEYNQNTKPFLICYELQNGKKVYRQYYVSFDVLKEKYSTVCDTAEGKEVLYPYLKLSGKEVDSATIYTPYMVSSRENLNLSQEEIIELVECYKKDLQNRKFEQLLEDRLLGCVTLNYHSVSSNTLVDLDIYISENYTNMIEFFKARKIDLTLPNEDYVIETVVAYNPNSVEETANHTFWKGQYEVYLNQEEIAKLLPYLVPEEYMYSSYQSDYRYHFDAIIRNVNTGAMKHVYYYVSEKYIPDYMKVE